MLIHRVPRYTSRIKDKIMKSRIILPLYILIFNTPHVKTEIAAQDAHRGFYVILFIGCMWSKSSISFGAPMSKWLVLNLQTMSGKLEQIIFHTCSSINPNTLLLLKFKIYNHFQHKKDDYNTHVTSSIPIAFTHAGHTQRDLIKHQSHHSTNTSPTI